MMLVTHHRAWVCNNGNEKKNVEFQFFSNVGNYYIVMYPNTPCIINFFLGSFYCNETRMHAVSAEKNEALNKFFL